jgi:hypothetical protein
VKETFGEMPACLFIQKRLPTRIPQLQGSE